MLSALSHLLVTLLLLSASTHALVVNTGKGARGAVLSMGRSMGPRGRAPSNPKQCPRWLRAVDGDDNEPAISKNGYFSGLRRRMEIVADAAKEFEFLGFGLAQVSFAVLYISILLSLSQELVSWYHAHPFPIWWLPSLRNL
mmetsp:Transcript_6828/g.12676  ORF Transcript_6828/g.12676 Transcript_6828/m.12676 type:complete len:141 (+) Transcript_6828:88-510(+)